MASAYEAHPGLTTAEKHQFYHLSEGSEIFPYDWLVRLKSSYEHDKSGNWDKFFFDGIESRVNILRDSKTNPYLSDYIGLSVSWSGHGPISSDALKSEDENTLLKRVGNTPSIRMAGINCAFCHVGGIKMGDKFALLDGSQALVNVQRLYGDMLESLLPLFFNAEDQLEHFLVRFNYTPEEAKTLAKAFAKQTIKETALVKTLQLALKQFGITKKLNPRLFHGEEADMAKHFERLLKITHRISAEDNIGEELRRKFQFISNYVGGSPKYTTQGGTKRKEAFHKANDGFGRLEAFVSVGNRLFRDRKDWVNVDNPVGYPQIWDAYTKAVFQYTGNTNASLIRDIGQAISIGAVVLDDKHRSSVKIDNLLQIENLITKLRPPNWFETLAQIAPAERLSELQIQQELADKGKRHFEAECASCHTPKMVGPQKNLEEYPFADLKSLGTDPNLAINAAKPTRGGTTYADLFLSATSGIMNQFKIDYPDKAKTVDFWREIEMRGKEWTRDTYHSQKDQFQGQHEGHAIVQKGSGYLARSLRGVWATAPFLHNNSVPTLWDLLQPTRLRPQVFERGINDFDPIKVGLKQRFNYTKDGKGLEIKTERGIVAKLNCKTNPDKFSDTVWEVDICHDSKLSGNSNAGHEFGVGLTDTQKFELIEYLKTL